MIFGIAGTEQWHPTVPSPSADRFSDLVGLTMVCSPVAVILAVLLGILALAVFENLFTDE